MPAILNIPTGAKKEDIKKAYYEAAKTHHPDKGGKKEDFQKLQNEYEAAIKACNELEVNVPVKSATSVASVQPKQPNVKEETVEQTIKSQRYAVKFDKESSNEARISALFGFLYNPPAAKKGETGKLFADKQEIGSFTFLGIFEQKIKYTQQVTVEQENANQQLLTDATPPLRIKSR